jgi:hypothetical protein
MSDMTPDTRAPRRHRQALRVVVSLTLLAALGPLTALEASAAVVWTPPRLLDSRGSDVTVASNAAGDSVAVWTRDEVPYAALRRGDGPWSTPRTWPYGGNMGTDQTAVMDDSGRATVAWLATDTGPNGAFIGHRLYVAQHHPRTGWSTPQLLSRMALGVPSLTVDPAGTVSAVWHELEKAVIYDESYEPAVELVKTASKTTSGPWSSPDLIDEGHNPSAAQAPDGTLTVVYVREHTEPAGFEVVTTSRTPGGPWPDAQSLSPVAPDVAPTPDTVSDAAGNVTAAWTLCTEGPAGRQCAVQTARTRGTGSWTAAKTLDEANLDAGRLTTPRLAVGGDDEVTAVWGLGPDPWGTPGTEVRAARQATDGVWEDQQTIASTPVTGVPDVAADPSGDVVATWTTRRPDMHTVRAAYRPAGAGWQAPTTVARESDTTLNEPRVVATGDDAFTTVFSRSGDSGVFYTDRVDDRTAPTVRLTRPARATITAPKIRVAWSAADSQAGVARVAVRRKVAPHDGRFGHWSMWKKSTTAKAATMRARPGRTYCFSAKATDRAGNTSRWSRARCTTTPVDDRGARATNGWRRVEHAKAYRGTQTVTNLRGQRLALPRASGKTLRLVATTCPRCGVVRVRMGNRDLGRVSLRSAKLKHKRVVHVASFPKVRTGRVVIRVVSSSKPVRIDGIVVAR